MRKLREAEGVQNAGRAETPCVTQWNLNANDLDRSFRQIQLCSSRQGGLWMGHIFRADDVIELGFGQIAKFERSFTQR